MLFQLFNKKRKYTGPVVDLIVDRIEGPSAWNDYVKSIFYGIYLTGTNTKVGQCDLRLGMNDELYYAGNIGYRIEEPYRGHRYAYHACRLLFEIAKEEYQMHELVITCSPDNYASKRTLELLNGTYLETKDVPNSHWLYKRGETIKNIYRYDL